MCSIYNKNLRGIEPICDPFNTYLKLLFPLNVGLLCKMRLKFCHKFDNQPLKREVTGYSKIGDISSYKIRNFKQKMKNVLEGKSEDTKRDFNYESAHIESLSLSLLVTEYRSMVFDLDKTSVLSFTKCGNEFNLHWRCDTAVFTCNMLTISLKSNHVTRSSVFVYPLPFKSSLGHLKGLHKRRIKEYGMVFIVKFLQPVGCYALLIYTFDGKFIYIPTTIDLDNATDILFTTDNDFNIIYVYVSFPNVVASLIGYDMTTFKIRSIINLSAIRFLNIDINMPNYYFLHHIEQNWLILGEFDQASKSITITWINEITCSIEDTVVLQGMFNIIDVRLILNGRDQLGIFLESLELVENMTCVTMNVRWHYYF